MVGYIYLTKNLVNGKIYIGKHISQSYDESYLGSGKILKNAIKKYGKHRFSNAVLYEAESLDELNYAEIQFIKFYKKILGKNLYNIAAGGEGGDVFKYATNSDKEEFILKMKKINSERGTINSIEKDKKSVE